MAEELLESEAIEEAELDADATEATARPLPERAARDDVSVWRDEMRTAAIAAAGGIVAGAATVAVVRATRGSSPRRRSQRRALLGRERPQRIVASRSFLVDIHLLGSK